MSKAIINWSRPLGFFGNQLFEYAFVKAYARKYDAELHTSDWIGRHVFVGVDDPLISVHLKQTPVDQFNFGQINIDLHGYFQSRCCYDLITTSDLKSIYIFKDEVTKIYQPRKEDYYIAAHVRRGDYVRYSDTFCIISDDSYLSACDKYGLDKSRIRWVTDDGKDNCCSYQSFLTDFFVLMDADVLLRANSTFSYWAGLLGGNVVYSPIVGDLVGNHVVEFVPGNHEQIISVAAAKKSTPLPPCRLVMSDEQE